MQVQDHWRGRARFTIVELGFGLGVNFLATLAAWRRQPVTPWQVETMTEAEARPIVQTLASRLMGGDS